MAQRAAIIVYTGKEWKGVYCHQGNPDQIAKVLLSHYSTPSNAVRLVAGTDLAEVGSDGQIKTAPKGLTHRIGKTADEVYSAIAHNTVRYTFDGKVWYVTEDETTGQLAGHGRLIELSKKFQ